jgi:phosphatidylinositol 3-kinase
MFKLMDNALTAISQDLRFTCYNALACSKRDGIMEFVAGSTTIQAIKQESTDVPTFLNSLSDEPEGRKEIMNNYLLSNAGYGVATYLMAIGDRHLENLLVKSNGDLFHLDFGFILGNNPKKPGTNLIPPIRINKAMVQGMNGPQSDEFKIFKDRTIDAFLTLRGQR